MKKFLVLMLCLHVLTEGGVGLFMAISPATFLPGAGLAELNMVTSYGFAAMTMASVVFWFLPQRHNAGVMATILGILATFHTAIVGAGAVMIATTGDPMLVVIHGVFAVCFWLLWAKRNQLEDSLS